MRYEIVDGKVQTRALEYHIVDHCNLNCANCCSFSPILPKWMCDVDQFRNDLETIKTALRPEFLKIVGGEPLLHPRIVDLLRVARETGVADRVSITTNGHLIKRMPEEAWSLFEMLTVSIYPFPQLSKETLFYIRQKAKENKISVSWKTQDKFVVLNRETKSDYETAKSVYAKCWIHHRCNSVKNGKFYSCTRPQYIQKFASNANRFAEDGVDLHAHDGKQLAHAIQTHLRATEPLNSCYLCKGGNAEMETHAQLSHKLVTERRERLRAIAEEV